MEKCIKIKLFNLELRFKNSIMLKYHQALNGFPKEIIKKKSINKNKPKNIKNIRFQLLTILGALEAPRNMDFKNYYT